MDTSLPAFPYRFQSHERSRVCSYTTRGKSWYLFPRFDAKHNEQAILMHYFVWYSCFRHLMNVNLVQSTPPTRRGVRGGQKWSPSARYSTFHYTKHRSKCLRLPLEPSQTAIASSSKALANNKDANRIAHVYGQTLRSSIYKYLFNIEISTRTNTTTRATRSDEMQQLPMNFIPRSTKTIMGV